MPKAVELIEVTKHFGPFTALERVSLAVEEGHLHAIVGENGAGKTTLMRVLYGAIRPDEGQVKLRGQEQRFRSSQDAIRHGVGMVSQHYAIIPELSCIQNLMLGAEAGGVFSLPKAIERAEQLATKMGFQFDWHQRAEKLGPAGSQKLEILKLLWRNAEIMILDEPTAMLSPRDADALFESLTALAREGKTVLLVTHRLPEVTEYCQEVTVLRGGKLITHREVSSVQSSELAELIVGHALTEFPARELPPSETVAAVQNLTVLGDRGDQAVKSVSFQLRQGELVGLAGVDGNGQRELIQALVGVRGAESGHVTLDGGDLLKLTTRERLAAGMRWIPEDRHHEAVIEDWSLAENAVLGFQRLETYRQGRGLDRKAMVAEAEKMIARFQTKCTGVQQPIGALSGGNQQRFVAARALAEQPRLILAFQPTRGLDIDATRAVYQGLREACEQGAAALIVSFDLDELLEFCDRIVVMNGGVLQAAQSKDRAEVGRLMVGAEA